MWSWLDNLPLGSSGETSQTFDPSPGQIKVFQILRRFPPSNNLLILGNIKLTDFMTSTFSSSRLLLIFIPGVIWPGTLVRSTWTVHGVAKGISSLGGDSLCSQDMTGCVLTRHLGQEHMNCQWSCQGYLLPRWGFSVPSRCVLV